jgi:hypothetical protein
MITLILTPALLLYIIPTVTNNKEISVYETIENEITTTTTVTYNQIIGTITTVQQL